MTTTKKLSLAKGKKLAYKLVDMLKEAQDGNIHFPEWQKKEVYKRIREMQKNPGKTISREAAQKKIKRLTK